MTERYMVSHDAIAATAAERCESRASEWWRGVRVWVAWHARRLAKSEVPQAAAITAVLIAVFFAMAFVCP